MQRLIDAMLAFATSTTVKTALVGFLILVVWVVVAGFVGWRIDQWLRKKHAKNS